MILKIIFRAQTVHWKIQWHFVDSDQDYSDKRSVSYSFLFHFSIYSQVDCLLQKIAIKYFSILLIMSTKETNY